MKSEFYREAVIPERLTEDLTKVGLPVKAAAYNVTAGGVGLPDEIVPVYVGYLILAG